MGIWVLSFMLMLGGFTAIVASDPENSTFVGWLTAGFLIVAGIWSVVMIRWMMAHSEIIDLDEMRKLKRNQKNRAKERARAQRLCRSSLLKRRFTLLR